MNYLASNWQNVNIFARIWPWPSTFTSATHDDLQVSNWSIKKFFAGLNKFSDRSMEVKLPAL